MSREGKISDLSELRRRLCAVGGFRVPVRPTVTFTDDAPDAALPDRPTASLLEGRRPYGEAVQAAFDMRPGELEATRIEPGSGMLVCGARDRASGAWRVLATVRGDDGLFAQVALEPEAARALGAELIDMAEICEGRRW